MKKIEKIKKLFAIPKQPKEIKFDYLKDLYKTLSFMEKNFENFAFLESLSESSEYSRYTLLYFNPTFTVEGSKNELTIKTQNKESIKIKTKNPYKLLKKLFPKDFYAKDYQGGLVGYISYDAFDLFEPSINLKQDSRFKKFKFGFYEDGIMIDKLTGQAIYFYYKTNRLNTAKKILEKTNSKTIPPNIKFEKDELDFKSYKEKIQVLKRKIIEGYIFQAVFSFKKTYSYKGQLYPVYQNLRKINPSPHMFFIKFSDTKIIGASPELLFRKKYNQIESFPLAGTIKRGLTKKEDQLLARKLLSDEKEIAEHSMLIDLHRNDIGRASLPGTVFVRETMGIKKFRYVQHIHSEVIGIIDPKEDMFSALSYSFPAGTLSGAPKIEAIKILNSLETSPRGIYGGAVGCFSLNGNCNFAIPIRTLISHQDKIYLQAGSGIVYDSKPEKEFEEVKNKLKSLETAIKNFLV